MKSKMKNYIYNIVNTIGLEMVVCFLDKIHS